MAFELRNPYGEEGYGLLPMNQQKSLLDQLGSQGISAVSYIGDILDKPGRAVRGLLSGNPRELLAALPFSDALGVTDPSQKISGKDLLARAGAIDPYDDSWTNFFLGLGAEIVTDPLTYVNPFAPLTKAGQIAKSAGIMPKGLRAVAQGISKTGLPENVRLKNLGFMPSDVVRKPLRGLVNVGLPFTEGVTLGTGTRSMAALDALGRALEAIVPRESVRAGATLGEALPYLEKVPVLRSVPNPVPYFRGLFDPLAGDVSVPAAQRIYGDVVHPGIESGLTDVAQSMAIRRERLANAGGLGDPAVSMAIRKTREAKGKNPFNLAEENDAIAVAVDIGKQDAAEFARILRKENSLGIPTAKFDEIDPSGKALGYDPRSPIGKPGDKGPSWRYQKLLSTWHPMRMAREEDLRNLPVETINAMYKDGRLSGPARVVRDPKQAAALILKEYLGDPREIDPLIRRAAEQAREAYTVADAKAVLLEDALKTMSPSDPAFAAAQSAAAAAEQAAETAKRLMDSLESRVESADTAYEKAVEQSKRLANRLANADPGHAKFQRGLFEQDAIADYGRRKEYHARVTSSAQGVHELFSQEAVPIAVAGADYVPLTEALERAGLTYNDQTSGAKVEMAKRLSKMFDGEVLAKDLDKYAVRPDIVAAATKWMRPFVAPESVRPFVQVWDALTNLFKGHVTQPFPAYHVRNFFTGVWQNWVTGAFDPTVKGGAANPYAYVKPYLDALKLANGQPIEGLAKTAAMKGANATDDAMATNFLAHTIYSRRVAGPGSKTQGLGEIVGPVDIGQYKAVVPGTKDWIERPSLSGLIPKSWEEANPFNVRGVADDVSKFTPVREGEKAQQFVEFLGRAANMIANLRQGKSMEVAAALSKATHLDYSMLTQFERNVARRIIPFYAFSRRNIPMILDAMVTNPARMAATFRLADSGRQEEGFVPSYVGEGAAVALPGAPPGQQRYLSSFGLPVEDELMGSLASMASGDAKRGGERFLGLLTPQIKLPLEMLAGKQFYSGRDLADLRPSLAGSLGGLLPQGAAQVSTQILANTPASRLAGIIDKLADERKGWGLTGVNLLTGARVTDVDVEKAKQIEGRKLVEEILRSSPNFTRFAKVVPTENAMANMTPRELDLYRLYLGLEREARKAVLRKEYGRGDYHAANRLRRMEIEDALR